MKKQDAVFIACEHSGAIRDKCLDNGILAFSCDLLDGEGEHLNYHIKGDVFKAYDILSQVVNIKIMIAHPSCTYILTVVYVIYGLTRNPMVYQGVLIGILI